MRILARAFSNARLFLRAPTEMERERERGGNTFHGNFSSALDNLALASPAKQTGKAKGSSGNEEKGVREREKGATPESAKLNAHACAG